MSSLHDGKPRVVEGRVGEDLIFSLQRQVASSLHSHLASGECTDERFIPDEVFGGPLSNVGVSNITYMLGK
jgi:hypothetical protein